jgi:hypothetical protein
MWRQEAIMEEEYSREIGWVSGFSTQQRHEEVERVMQLGSIMSQEWDRSMYYLMTIDPQAYLDLILPGLRYLGCLPERLEGPHLIMDVLLKTETIKGRHPLLVHLESETYHNSKMPERLLEYNKAVREKYKTDVISGVFHLQNDTAIEPSPLVWETPLKEWSRVLTFNYPVVEMKDLIPEEIRSRGRAALLPILPLTNGGAKRHIVQSMLSDLRRLERPDLFSIAFRMAVRKMSDQGRKWLREEYTMEYDALRMDPLYWILQKDSREEGGIQTAQQIAINVVAKRFPGLKERAQKSIATVNDLQRLHELVPELSVLSQGEVDEILERLGKNQLQEEMDL